MVRFLLWHMWGFSLQRDSRKHMEWLSTDTWNLIIERKKLKGNIYLAQNQEKKYQLQVLYWETNWQIKKRTRQMHFHSSTYKRGRDCSWKERHEKTMKSQEHCQKKISSPARSVIDKNGKTIRSPEGGCPDIDGHCYTHYLWKSGRQMQYQKTGRKAS